MAKKNWKKYDWGKDMPLEVGFTVNDLKRLQKEEPRLFVLHDEPSLLYKSLPLKLSTFLSQAGRKNGKIDLLRRPNGEVAYGAARIPMVLTEPNGEISVIKEYEDNPEREKEVLKHLSGRLIPRIKYLGDEFYLEELIGSRYKRLRDMATAGKVSPAISLNAKAQADLYGQGYILFHPHSFDDIFASADTVLFADVGNARQRGPISKDDDFFNRRKQQLQEDSRESYLRLTLSPFSANLPAIHTVAESLGSISRNDDDFLNHWDVARMAAFSLHRLFGATGEKNPWNKAMKVFPKYVGEYVENILKI